MFIVVCCYLFIECAFIERYYTPKQNAAVTRHTLTATQILALPPEERKRIVAEQLAEAAQLYAKHPDALGCVYKARN